jgi:glutamine synthetase
MITCFNSIADGPFGSTGDLILVPDESTEVLVDWQDGAPLDHFFLGNLQQLDGKPWSFCPRYQLQRALDQLAAEAGLVLRCAFEHELWYSAADDPAWSGFGLGSFRRNAVFAEALVAALEQSGIESDTVIAEYGNGQLEFTVAPTLGLRAADECIMVRELARSLALRMGQRVSFSPVVNPGVGNGLHLHFSLELEDGTPATYALGNALDLTPHAGQFIAGVQKYLPDIVALTAPSVVSYERLQPHRWSAAFNNIATQDREAALRICPMLDLPGYQPESQYHAEFRASDATANAWLQLAAIVFAGVQGIRDKLPVPGATKGDLSLMSTVELAELGVQRLPTSLEESLQRLDAQPRIREWFGDEFIDVYLAHKRGEIAFLEGHDADEVRKLYAAVY